MIEWTNGKDGWRGIISEPPVGDTERLIDWFFGEIKGRAGVIHVVVTEDRDSKKKKASIVFTDGPRPQPVTPEIISETAQAIEFGACEIDDSLGYKVVLIQM